MTCDYVDFDLLFDAADAYRRTGVSPWTFFAYPTSLARKHDLPPDEDACRLLGEVQARGIEVAIWVNAMGTDTTYFACRNGDRNRLTEVLEDLEKMDSFGKGFCEKRCEELFALLEQAPKPGEERDV